MKRIPLGASLVFGLASLNFAQTPLYRVDGPGPKAQLGIGLAGAGDVNGDGVDDFLVGAPGAETMAGAASGRATVVSGADGSTLRTFEGSTAGDGFGGFVAGLGDLNGDGFAEVAISATSFDGARGQVQIFNGLDGMLLYRLNGRAANDFFGVAVANVGDLNNDMVPDFAIGALGFDPLGPNFGMIEVYSGANADVLLTVDGAPDDSLGSAVAGLGDVNGDSVPDFVVGLPSFSGAAPFGGGVRVLSGANGSVVHSIGGNLTYGASNLGHRVIGLGDVNGDAVPDFAAGNFSAMPPGLPANIGEVTVYDGATGVLEQSILGRNEQDRFGFSLAACGDVDGDGVPDWVAGAPSGSTPFPEAGEARVHSGANGLELMNLQGEQLGSGFGTAVASGVDINADGVQDVLVGANLHSENAFEAGRATAFLSGVATLPSFSYCITGVNSLGRIAQLQAFGSPTATDNQFFLQVFDAPSQQFSFFLISRGQDQIQQPGGSSGNLCLGGGEFIGRYVGQVGQTQANQYHAQLDIHAVPIPPNFDTMVLGGETWYFQSWFRDLGGTSNFSTGLGVVFE